MPRGHFTDNIIILNVSETIFLGLIVHSEVESPPVGAAEVPRRKIENFINNRKDKGFLKFIMSIK